MKTPDAAAALTALCATHPRALFGVQEIQNVLELPVPAAVLREVNGQLSAVLYADEAGAITGHETALFILSGDVFTPASTQEAREAAAALPALVTVECSGDTLTLSQGEARTQIDLDSLSGPLQELLRGEWRFSDPRAAHARQLQARRLLERA